MPNSPRPPRISSKKSGSSARPSICRPTAQDKSRFYEMRGEYYFQNQDYDKAIDDLSKALMLIPAL